MPSSAVPRLTQATLMHMILEARAAVRSLRRRSRATHQPLMPSVISMPATNALASAITAGRPRSAVPVAAISAAWLSVSNERANRTPTPMMVQHPEASRTRAKTPLRHPTPATIASGAAWRTAFRFIRPSSNRTRMEAQAPNGSSHAGAVQERAISDTDTATAMTTAPCPSENQNPVRRASRGRATALKRVIPSIAAR